MVASIFLIAVILILGQVFSSLFEKTRIPDVLPLMLLGFMLGPVLKLVAPDSMGSVDVIFTEIVLIVILFQTGFNFRFSYLRDSFWAGLGFTVPYIILSTGVLYLLSYHVLKLPFIYSIAMAFILADTSLVVLVPILAKLNITQETRSILTIETTLESIICVVVALAVINMAGQAEFSAKGIFIKIFYSFIMASIVGIAAGIFWSAILKYIRKLENSTALTFAFVLLVYTLSEWIGSKGAIGVLMFGLIVGNIRVLNVIIGRKFKFSTDAFKGTEKSFFTEIEFIFKTLFFVYMGLSMYMQNTRFILCGLLLALAKIFSRYIVVQYCTPKRVNRRDAATILAMCPNGLVSAVLAATAGAQMGGQNGIQDTAYSVIFFSLIITSILSFFIEKGYVDGAANIMFYRHDPIPQEEKPAQETPEGTEPENTNHPSEEEHPQENNAQPQQHAEQIDQLPEQQS
ncbi:NhaP-type Na+/H+ or K+/H+ antiporter [Elusimicrobium posterum]|uniref:cation:proton antiporter n=1 Tax=Elusimicrobium posterum TaxID=3116653 RepID=UPI003C73A26E